MAHGNLPPGFDPGTCLSVYVGNLHIQTTEPLLQEVFARAGPVKSCKLVRQKNSSYGFVHYFDYRSPARAITYLNRSYLFEQPIKVDYAYTRGQREDTSGHYNIFVGNLSAEVTDAVLFECFSVYPSCSDARVMWDQKTGLSRGFGFVSFRSQQNAQNAINDLTGKWLGSRQIRCTWATKEDVKEAANSDAPENNPQYTTVYVGNLAPEVTQANLHHYFYALGAGSIEEVRVQRDKGFGFVRYSTHGEAAMAISVGNARPFLCGRHIKCSWSNEATPPGTASNPLKRPAPATPGTASNPLKRPAPATIGGLSGAELLAYEQPLAMSKMGLMGQHPLKQGSMGMGAGASQAMYDGSYC